MHTQHELTSETFAYRRGGEPVTREAVLPPISVADRLGVVMADPVDGLGAGNFVLSCVTAFYDVIRERREELTEYPDYFTFQATDDPVDYLEFDVWPDHKNVAVPADPAAVLRAVNDRAVTLLLVPDGPAGDPVIEDVTRGSAARRLDACYLYGTDGSVDDPDVSIRLPRNLVAGWYRETARKAGLDGDVDGSVDVDGCPGVDVDGEHVTQSFRRVGLDEALSRLPGPAGAPH